MRFHTFLIMHLAQERQGFLPLFLCHALLNLCEQIRVILLPAVFCPCGGIQEAVQTGIRLPGLRVLPFTFQFPGLQVFRISGGIHESIQSLEGFPGRGRIVMHSGPCRDIGHIFRRILIGSDFLKQFQSLLQVPRQQGVQGVMIIPVLPDGQHFLCPLLAVQHIQSRKCLVGFHITARVDHFQCFQVFPVLPADFLPVLFLPDGKCLPHRFHGLCVSAQRRALQKFFRALPHLLLRLQVTRLRPGGAVQIVSQQGIVHRCFFKGARLFHRSGFQIGRQAVMLRMVLRTLQRFRGARLVSFLHQSQRLLIVLLCPQFPGCLQLFRCIRECFPKIFQKLNRLIPLPFRHRLTCPAV